MENDFFLNEIFNIKGMNLQALIASRLEDMAEQVELLYTQGNYAEAELLRDEGLELAEAYDNETVFMFINDLTEV
jgi:hypothetical protein